jgi:glycosyltransferase involved in cell wall biosynthesis
VTRYPGWIAPHIVVPIRLRTDLAFDVVIDDLAHVLPWLSPTFTRAPGVVFFRHLHTRTLYGQVRRPLADVLSLVETRYSLFYRDWPFVTESQQSIEDLVSLGIARSRCRRIVPGVDRDLFHSGRRSETPTIIYFAGLRKYKRPNHALEVLRRLRANGLNCRLEIVGAGPYLSDLIRSAREMEIADWVGFAGRVSKEQLAIMVRGAWVNLHCAVAEGWGLSTQEAAASGIPTVGYRVPGIAESVQDGQTGVLVKDGDLEALTGATKSILANPEGWTQRCLKYASTLDWEVATDRWESVLRELPVG